MNRKWTSSKTGRLALGTALLASADRWPAAAPRSSSDSARSSATDAAAAAQKVYVAPGELDEYYLFASGGHSGQVYVYGVPSMRHISTIPVFTPYPATGYGFDDDSKKMLGNLTWGDVHHPSLSETNGDYDGRWLFVNEMNGRVARIDLRDFKTKQILGPVANVSGNHGSAFVTPNTEYTMMASASRSRSPRAPTRRSTSTRPTTRACSSGVKVDPKSGEMAVGWQILTPPFDWDLGDAGKKASERMDVLVVRTTLSAPSASSKSPPRSAIATTSRRSTGRRPSGRRLKARAR